MYAFDVNITKCPHAQDDCHVAPAVFYSGRQSARSACNHLRRCADTAHTSMNQAIPEMDCATLIIHKACGDLAWSTAGPDPRSSISKDRYGHRLERHVRTCGIVCRVAGRSAARFSIINMVWGT